MKKIILAIVICSFVISGILFAGVLSDEEIEMYKGFLTSQKWVIDDYTAFPYHDIDGDGIAHFDMMNEFDPLLIDDEWVFNEDGTYYLHQSDLKHEFYVKDEYVKGTWELIDNGTVLEMTGLEHNGQAINHIEHFYILELGPHAFSYFNEVNHSGININVLMTLIPTEGINQKVLGH